jgi:hypothetical protein
MAVVCYGIVDCNKALVRYRFRENPKRDFENVTEELAQFKPQGPKCWEREDDFPDPPHWTTKLWRCAFKRSK